MSGHGKKIIVVKKKIGGHEGHHGGSWKVAYADFVTAMMAFFMVMWIMGMDQGVKDMVQGYFQNPVGFKRGYSGGHNILSQGNSLMVLQGPSTLLRRRWEEQQLLEEVAGTIRSSLDQAGITDDMGAAVEFVMTEHGLRIEMMETGEGETFFEKSSAQLKPALRVVLGLVAEGLSDIPNNFVVEGHTDVLSFGGAKYSNWELSVDRANGARRILALGGLPEGRFVEVRGYADRQLKVPDAPRDPRNRRISVLLPFETEIEIDTDGTDFIGIAPLGAASIGAPMGEPR